MKKQTVAPQKQTNKTLGLGLFSFLSYITNNRITDE
jgi:hypothetical protein